MKFAILGGGFGLYGYMPALFRRNFNVILPTRYQQKIKARNEIVHFYNNITWLNSDEDCLAACQGTIIALPPIQQIAWLKKCTAHNSISHFLLEKPLANTPILAINLMNDLQKWRKKFRIAYNFRYTSWGKAILQNKSAIKSITWNFRAHHYQNNVETWKRRHSEGGGALRFYGIHLIAFLAELGYHNVMYSKIEAKNQNEAEIWQATLLGDDLLACTLTVNSNSEQTQFLIKNYNDQEYYGMHPFQDLTKNKVNKLDERVPILVEGISDLLFSSENYPPWYEKTNLLWSEIEQRTVFS